MDARRLEFPSESFDIAYSLSSIEHFGSPEEIARSAAEMGRVLKPGGTAVVVTECLVHLDAFDRAPVEFAWRVGTLGRKRSDATPRRRMALGEAFTPRELDNLIVQPSGLGLVQPLDTGLSPPSWDNLTTVHPGGRLAGHRADPPARPAQDPPILLHVRVPVAAETRLTAVGPGLL